MEILHFFKHLYKINYILYIINIVCDMLFSNLYRNELQEHRLNQIF